MSAVLNETQRGEEELNRESDTLPLTLLSAPSHPFNNDNNNVLSFLSSSLPLIILSQTRNLNTCAGERSSLSLHQEHE